MSSPFVYIDESTVAELLTWPLVIHAVDQALQSVVDGAPDDSAVSDLPNSVQNARTATILPNDTGLLFTMPAFIGNYTPLHTTSAVAPRSSTLGCKLVTSFQANTSRQPPQPAIAANIVLLEPTTGSLQAILHGTQITTWRTVAASLVATRTLWFGRQVGHSASGGRTAPILAIVGCGVEGRAHAIGMASTFPFGAIRMWNRTASRAHSLRTDLLGMCADFAASEVSVSVSATVADCVRDADVIVVATYADKPLIDGEMLRRSGGVHINAVGAGPGNHHTELADSVYSMAQIYVDSMVSARVELATLAHPIVGQVGEVMVGRCGLPAADACTVFQSMGMAVEDCAVAQAVFDRYKQQRLNN